MKITDRYTRQMNLPEIGATGQKRLSESSVLCVGAGGLGSPALLYLAAAGIGKIGIIDFDVVEETNLHRQVLFTAQDLGQYKVFKAQEHLQKINPHIQIEAFNQKLAPKNIESLLRRYGIILDGSDNFETKFLINDACVKFGKPFVYGALYEFDGQVSILNVGNGPCYRCLYPTEPQVHIKNCHENGIVGAVAGLIGITQALQIIQFIVNHDNFQPLIGKLWLINTKTMETSSLQISKNPHCPTCSINQDAIKLSISSQHCHITEIPEIPLPQIKFKRDTLIDVREQDEWDQGHIPGALHSPLSLLLQGNLPNLPLHQPIVIYCYKGIRSQQAGHILKKQGFNNIKVLSGGYQAWQQQT